mgnify:CR=1 FL=1
MILFFGFFIYDIIINEVKYESKSWDKEYLDSSNFFLENSQTKYLNALLDNIGKKLRSSNAWIWIN